MISGISGNSRVSSNRKRHFVSDSASWCVIVSHYVRYTMRSWECPEVSDETA